MIWFRAAFTVILAGSFNVGLAADPAEPVVLQGHSKSVTAVAWSPDGKTVVTAGDDRSIRTWDPVTGRETSSQTGVVRDGYGGPVFAFSADLKIVAVSYWGEVTIRNVADGKTLLNFDAILDRGQKSAFRPDVFAMAFSPDGKLLATAGSIAAVGGNHGLPGGMVMVWDVTTAKIVHQSRKLSTAASTVMWSPDGKLIAAGTNGAGGELPEPGEVRIWDAPTWSVRPGFAAKSSVEQGEWASVGEVVFSPDSRSIAVPVTAGSRGAPAGLIIQDTGASVRIWNLETGKSTQPVKGLRAAVGKLVFTPDGRRLATAGRDKVVRIWDLETGKELAAMSNPERAVVIAFSPDGESLVCGSENGSARILPLSALK